MVAFRILAGIDAVAAVVALFFFFWGVSDGTVSSFNILIWLVLLVGIAVVLGGGFWLRSAGQQRLANGVLSILAIPVALIALFFLALVGLQPRWN